jgi:hypothetical protein
MKWIFTLLTFFSLKAFSQPEYELVKIPINNLFEGMRLSDTALLKAAFAPSAILQTITKSKEGKVDVRTEVIKDFITFIAKPHPEIFDERIHFEVIRIDADLAVVWTPYNFFVGKKFSHCGVNSFQLIKLNGNWKIQYLIDTRRKDGCDKIKTLR